MSFVEIKGYQYQGLEKKEISVQGIKTRGMGQLSLSGNLSASLRDSRDKIKAVVARYAPWGPVDKILLNLLPSDLSKFSPHLELPMALSMLALLWPEALNEGQLLRLKSVHYSGSLSLSGDLCESELLCEGAKISTFKNLNQVWAFVLTGEIPVNEKPETKVYFKTQIPHAEKREYEKFWLGVAAHAKLPVLLIGPPGVGKSHLARWALSCLQSPTDKLREEIDRIWILSGKEELPEIPFQNPHSRTHLSEFVGVARHEVPRPGVFSLAHGGLLVLDEFSELARDSREILRNILDEKKVVKNTKAGFCTWPADFWLILTANPCPCGYAQGTDLSRCRCQENTRQKYLARFSGPLLDRMGVKMFLTEAELKMPPLQRRHTSGPAPGTTFSFSSFKLTARENTIYEKLWRAFLSQVEHNEISEKFFLEFLQSQKDFSRQWLVNGYE